jgi:hypothetical protein
MNLLPPEKLAAIEKCFAEQRGIRETERLTGVHRDTVSRYFRLLSDPAPNATPERSDSPAYGQYVLIEHDDDWHVFYVHNDTPDWWRHVAVFHNEKRARLYVEDCTGWLDAVSAGEDEDHGHPISDETPAPARLPAPPPTPETTENRHLTKEERAAARERRQDELAAALPERRCAVCDVVLTRRAGEPVGNFAIRQTCTPEHAQVRREQARARKENGAAVPQPEPAPILAATQEIPADDYSDEVINEENHRAHKNDPLDRPSTTPPGYHDCPDCVWSGPRTEYQDHRRTDHGTPS